MSKKVVEFDEAALRKEIEILKRENQAAFKTIDKLLKELNKKAEEITHLQSLAQQVIPVLQKPDMVRVDMSPEEEIADIQLEKLRQASQSRTLTLEEARIYDLLVKNKRLAQEQSTINLGKADYKNVSSANLIEIAGKVVDVKDPAD